MVVQSIWGAVRRFLTPKVKKARDWKRIYLIASFSGAGVSFIGLVFPTIVQLNEVSYTLKTFAFADAYHETAHAKSTQFLGVSISLVVLILAQAAYFFIFWPGYDHTVLRTSAILVSVPVNLALAWVQFTTLDDIFSLPIDPGKSKPHSIGVLDDEIQERYDHLARGMGRVKWFIPVISISLTIVYCGAVVFWLWLLPSRHRLPNRYEPVIFSKETSAPLTTRVAESIELTEIAMSNSAGHLEAIFREHENARVHNLLTLRTSSPSTRRRRVGISPRAPRRSSTGPELAPDARYWMLSNAEDDLKFWVIGMISFIVFGLGSEIPTYAILRANELKCPWYAVLPREDLSSRGIYRLAGSFDAALGLPDPT
ncbi:hypothetical protein NPX13_g5994 [Xylaria arbuscula]|uniref:Uncharacterized protein n=1 Tax=Xylaria arbuscula TaxID=114810 RepID=A0A9W8NCN7_9PEZI|nr:hypothetical protein NPX13_g5994 [Xylaria arbuscula]